MRRVLGFLVNLVAGIAASPGAHPIVATDGDGTRPGRRRPRSPRRR
ncbi:hypothetical protein [Agrococcus versicolor]